MGRVVLNILNEKRRALPYLCHFSPQMPLIINIEFFNKLNTPGLSFKSMMRLTELGHLKRMGEYDLKTLLPSYEAFSQLVRCSQALAGPEKCKLKNKNWQVSEDGIVYLK